MESLKTTTTTTTRTTFVAIGDPFPGPKQNGVSASSVQNMICKRVHRTHCRPIEFSCWRLRKTIVEKKIVGRRRVASCSD